VRCSIRVIIHLGVVLVAGAVLANPVGAASAPTAAKPKGAITVSAAASLTDAFHRIGARFEQRYEGTDVTFNFDSSSALVLQVQSGAPVDVFASADESNMAKLVDGGQVRTKPIAFARNQLEIATKPGNPTKIKNLADLDSQGVVALCAAEVPCGKYADAALDAAGVEIPSDHITRATNAKATLTAVATGDADAAVVYVTDVRTAGATVGGVVIPDSQNQIAIYPIAPLAETANRTTAKAFARSDASPAGQKILAKYGFLAP